MQNFFELQLFSWQCSWFLELSMFTNASLPNILFDKMDRGLEHEKNNILLNTVFIFFSFLKNFYG